MFNDFKKFVHNFSDAEIRSIFVDRMRMHGLIFDGRDLPIIMDGRTRYVKVEGRSRGKKNSRSGWYSGHLGDFPNGRFGWLHGDSPLHTWSLYQHIKDTNGSVDFVQMSEEDVLKRKKDREREERRRLEQDRQRASFSKAFTIIEWNRALPLVQHPYLEKKKFSIQECSDHVRILNKKDYTANEIKAILDQHFPEYNKPANIRKLLDYQLDNMQYRGFNLVLKGEVISGDPMMLQFIFNKKSKTGKDKHFPRELIKQNTFLNIGKKLDSECPEVIICEGWATGISISRFTNNQVPILVAWDSGNMTAVAIEVRRTYPNIRINSANDNDHTQPLEKNAGIRGGIKTCNAVSAYMVSPPFDSSDPLQAELSDWNDIDSFYPPHESSRIFHEAIRSAKQRSAIYDPHNLLLSNESTHTLNNKIEVMDGPLWQMHFTTMARLISKGIQHCRYTNEEQLAMYLDGFTLINQYFENKGFDKINRIYDSSLDSELADIFHDFILALHVSETHIMHDSGLMQPMLKQLKPLQTKIKQLNLLHTLKDLIAEKYSIDTANLCIPYHLSNNHYFSRSHKQWLHDLSQALSLKIPDINLYIALPLILTTKEVKYWEQLTPEQRIEQACNEIGDLYQHHENNQIKPERFSEQGYRANYLQGSLFKHLIQPSDQTHEHLIRVIDRLNQVESTNITIEQLATDFFEEPNSAG